MKKRLIQVLIFVILIAGIVGYMAIDKMKEKYTPTTEHMDLYTYFGVEEDDESVIIFLNNVKIEGDAIAKDGRVYISHTMVEDYFSENFYWDESAKQLLYTTATVLYKYSLDSNKYSVNGEEKLADYPVVIGKGENIYLCMDFVQEYADVQYRFYEEPNRLMLINEWTDTEYVEINEDAGIRKLGGIKSPIVIDAKAGEQYLYINEIDEWTCVMNEAGVKGYIETKYTGNKFKETLTSNYTEPVYSNISRDYKINLVWHQVTNKDANANLSKVMEGVTGVNVISPTWFQMCDNGGNIISFASQDYVDKAHAMGLEVWALVENITYSKSISTYKILSNMESRERLVDVLIEEVLKYDIDGINVDIESLSYDAGDAYLQFLRELSIECRKNGIVLSVDNYVPSASTYHYHRKEQGQIADYVIIMGYDEHYAGSSESGSVASLGWVEEGIVNTLKLVPADKVINAMPFYTRIWKQTPESEAKDKSAGVLVEDPDSKYGRYLLTSEAVSMAYAQQQLKKNGVTPEWQETVGQYYGEYEKDGCTYQIWLEEEDSIARKMTLIKEYELAGVAGWKLSLQKNGIWEVIDSYLK